MVFFVTGGSRGIGAGIVLQAIREGHEVAFTYRTNEERARQVVEQARAIAPAGRARAWKLDVTSSAEVEQVANAVLDEFDTVDVVVANAGINMNNLVVSMTDEQWHAVIQTNLTGAFYVARQFLPTMLGNRFGRIIFMSSLGAGGVTGQANYAASKAGLIGLTKSVAKELASRNIVCNAVAPGFIQTDMTDAMTPEARAELQGQIPLERLGAPGDVAQAVAFLASDMAAYMTGQVLVVDGGLLM